MLKLARNVLIAMVACLASGCATLNSISDSLFTDYSEENREAQDMFETQKAAIEQRAAAGYLTWVQAARNVRDVDRSLVGRGTWKFDGDDEEYHAFCIALAERLDSKRITFSQYDALRTQRFSQIAARRQQLINSQPRSGNTNCRSVRNPDGSVSTTCY